MHPGVDYAAVVDTPFGPVGIATNATAVTRVRYLDADVDARAPRDAIAALAAREIARYLDDPGYAFTVALAPQGSAFQRRVWDAIAAIPAGASRTYGELAQKLQSAPRAVGQACGANPIALLIPCHRVIGSRGALGGFMHSAGAGPLAVKRWLLAHEGSRFGLA
ncbi:MAG: methylated-DNA--[protein]-cysteine S-methyltransferase [Proteobacteria bacterium]|nr:methylated-DNA--[protein]-cysteine S-methyltransferase [Pseudomonadota bacterium]